MKKTLALTAAFAMLAGSAAAEEVTLKAASAFATGTTFARPFAAFVDWVNENGKGVLQINVVGGPEAVPPFELGNAVSSGVVDLANNTAAFYTNLLPEGDALKLATNTIQEQRENGCYDIIDEMHQSAMNVKYLARTGGQRQFPSLSDQADREAGPQRPDHPHHAGLSGDVQGARRQSGAHRAG